MTRPIGAAHGAVAIAVYADERGVPLPAADRGHEGVACVDDAARAVTLLCDLEAATRLPFVRAWAAALLEFLLYMQSRDGWFANFVSDWAGTRNQDGPTSFAGGSFWQARGLHALARACRTFDDPRLRAGLESGMAHVRTANVPANVRAIHVLAAMELWRGGVTRELRMDLEAWCAELLACRRGGVLFDDPDQTSPHLWGHIQEGVLAEAGALLGRADLVAVARESAMRFLAPHIDDGFALPHIEPYGVASALFGVQRLAEVTGDRAFLRLAERARAWFHERNAAGIPVYDRASGKVHDGIDGGILSEHSGAEANIVAAHALFPELSRNVRTHGAAIAQLLPPAATPALRSEVRRSSAVLGLRRRTRKPA